MAGDGGREFFAGLSQSFFGVDNEIGGPEALHSEDQTGRRPRYQMPWKISTSRGGE